VGHILSLSLGIDGLGVVLGLEGPDLGFVLGLEGPGLGLESCIDTFLASPSNFISFIISHKLLVITVVLIN